MQDILTQPLVLPCGAVIRNRIMKAAMTEGLADRHGRVTDRLTRLYRTWANGGAGLLVTGNVMIDGRYLERPGNIVVDDNDYEDGLAALARAGTSAGNHLWMQISHPGRQCSRIVNAKPVSPSDVQLKIMGNFARPRAMTTNEIDEAIENYARVARAAQRAGFTGVQIHGAHGYLISQFLSPITNQRRDEWGGPIEQRAQFLLRVIDAVRRAVGADFPVAVKLNSADFQKGGFSLDDSRAVARMLNEAKIDMLEISGGTYEHPRLLGLIGDAKTIERPVADSTRRREAYFLDYARSIREVAAMPLAVTGGFRSRAFMVDALEADELDVVGLARPLCVEPDLPARLLAGSAAYAPAYEESIELGKRWFGAASPITAFKALNSQASVAWFYRQIIALSEGREPNTGLSARTALTRHFRDEYRLAWRRRQALKAAPAAV